jgi:hypothetical protein
MTFVPDERPVAPNVGRSLDELIEEGLRRGEALHRSNRLISSDRVVFQFAAGPARGQVCAVGSTEWRVLRLVDGVRDVGELVAGTGLPRAEVVRVLVELVEGGLVERIEPQRDLRVRSHGLFGGKGTASLDQRVEEDWRKLQRFGRGVLRVEVRSAAGRGAVLPVQFRASLGREVHLSREIIGELRVSEGDEVHVRPVG